MHHFNDHCIGMVFDWQALITTILAGKDDTTTENHKQKQNLLKLDFYFIIKHQLKHSKNLS